MPGEQLTCVLQLFHKLYGGSTLQKSKLSSVFSKLNISNLSTKDLFRELNDPVTFSQMKDFVISNRGKHTKIEIQDSIESLCWSACKSVFSGQSFDVSNVFKLWQIFNRLTNEESYPPVISIQDSAWLIEKFVGFADGVKGFRFECTDHELSFLDFLSCLENLFTSTSITQATKEIHDWLVKEVLRGGWVYMRSRRRSNWSLWSKKWMTLSPGKLLFSKSKTSEHLFVKRKIVFYLSEQTHIKIIESTAKGMTHVIQVSNADSFECQIATLDQKKMKTWLSALNDSVKYYIEDTSPIRRILMKQNDKKKTDSLRFFEREKSFLQSKEEQRERKTEKEDGLFMSDNKVFENDSFQLHSTNIERDKIKAIFLELDKDGNGVLNEQEFSRALEELGLEITEIEARKIFNKIDVDKNEKILFTEFYDYFLEKILSGSNSTLPKAFIEADQNQRGAIKFREFSENIRQRKNSLSLDKILTTFDKVRNGDDKNKLTFQDLQSISFLDEVFEFRLRSKFDTCNIKELRNRIEERWEKYQSFKREGENGEIVMTGADRIVEDIVPGEYNLRELAQFDDLPKLLPKRTILQNVSWETGSVPNTSGNLVFPDSFDGIIEVEIATSELLAYYGCTFADDNAEKISIPYRHAIQDFTYGNDYLADYVEKKNGGAGVERHGFSHLDCPLDDESGYFILGKMSGEEIHFTAFKIPRRHTLYVPGHCIHSNDYLRGTWRTMLSDEADIDHVFLKRKICNNKGHSLKPLTFKFSW